MGKYLEVENSLPRLEPRPLKLNRSQRGFFWCRVSSRHNTFSTTNEISLGWFVYHRIRIFSGARQVYCSWLRATSQKDNFCTWSRNATFPCT